MSRQGRLSIERMCDLAQVSRASFYRSLRAYQPMEEAMEVRSAIQGIAVAHRRRDVRAVLEGKNLLGTFTLAS